MTILNREQLEKLNDRKIITLHVSEWEQDVCLGSLSVEDTLKFERAVREEEETQDNVITKYVALSLVDEKGEKLFPDLKEGMQILGKKSTAAILQIFQEAQKLNSMEEGDIEKLAKN